MTALVVRGLIARWATFLGSVITVAIGVALVQSSLLLLLSAAGMPAPAGADPAQVMRFEESRIVVVTVVAVTLGFAAFLAVFIIASTFSFTVDQRRRELAMLRLAGASRGQLRRMLLGEAVVLGAVGAAAGVPLGVAAERLQAGLLVALGFAPAGFAGEWRFWAPGVAVGTGVGLAVAGVLLAARRATRVRPLDALRSGSSRGTMTTGRWIAAGVALVGSVALLVLIPVAGPAGGQAMAMSVSITLVVAFALLAPVIVPTAARLVRWPGSLGLLAVSAIRDDPRRSASVAAPIIVLVGLVVGQSGAMLSIAHAAAQEQRTSIAADLVLDATGPVAGQVAAADGVQVGSTEYRLAAAVTTGEGDLAFTEVASVLVVDPAAYDAVRPAEDSLGELSGRSAAAGPAALGSPIGSTVGVRVADVDLGRLPVVAAVPAALSGGAALILPVDAVPAELLEQAPSVSYITTDDPAAVAGELAILGTVSTRAEWSATLESAGTSTTTGILTIVLGLGSLYAVLGVVNAVLIAAGGRVGEFAGLRALGLHRRQVVGMAFIEGATIIVAGVLLGLLAAAGTFVGVLAATGAVGSATLAVPWALLATVAGGALAVGLGAAVLAAAGTSRGPLVAALRARS